MTLKRSETAEFSIVIPRCCSSSLLSRYLIFPAILKEMILFAARRASMSVVFPWSTWPIVVTFLTNKALAACSDVTAIPSSNDLERKREMKYKAWSAKPGCRVNLQKGTGPA